MALSDIFPNAKQLTNELMAIYKNNSPQSNPFKEKTFINTFFRALGTSLALTYDYFKTKILDNLL